MPDDASLLKEKISLAEPSSIEAGFGAHQAERPLDPDRSLPGQERPETDAEASGPIGSDPESAAAMAEIPPLSARQARKRQVDSILEKDMGGLFLSLSPEKRLLFKTTGEETASKIVDLLEKGAVKARDIMKLIIKWLSILPGVNRFFIEQEAKIKADEIMKLNG